MYRPTASYAANIGRWDGARQEKLEPDLTDRLRPSIRKDSFSVWARALAPATTDSVPQAFQSLIDNAKRLSRIANYGVWIACIAFGSPTLYSY